MLLTPLHQKEYVINSPTKPRVLIVGAGPAGLRMAIEASLLGARFGFIFLSCPLLCPVESLIDFAGLRCWRRGASFRAIINFTSGILQSVI